MTNRHDPQQDLPPAFGVSPFGTLSDGRDVHRVTLRNDELTVSLLDLGALIQDVRLSGIDHSLTLGSPDAGAYESMLAHFGAVMGPVANRITGAKAEIDGTIHRFDANQDGRHCLHGGRAGTHLKIWSIEEVSADRTIFTLILPNGEGGFPGTRRLRATYSIDGPCLRVDLSATADATTLINLANHGYWTMQEPTGWAGQRLTIHAERYLPTDDEILPTGEIAEVAGTPYDFRQGRELEFGVTPKLDTNFCLADAPRALAPAVRLEGPTGLALDLATTAPGMQVFDMGFFDIDETTLHGHPYARRAALAFEPQSWPDAPGRPTWPSIVLRPEEPFEQSSTYRFSRP